MAWTVCISQALASSVRWSNEGWRSAVKYWWQWYCSSRRVLLWATVPFTGVFLWVTNTTVDVEEDSDFQQGQKGIFKMWIASQGNEYYPTLAKLCTPKVRSLLLPFPVNFQKQLTWPLSIAWGAQDFDERAGWGENKRCRHSSVERRMQHLIKTPRLSVWNKGVWMKWRPNASRLLLGLSRVILNVMLLLKVSARWREIGWHTTGLIFLAKPWNCWRVASQWQDQNKYCKTSDFQDLAYHGLVLIACRIPGLIFLSLVRAVCRHCYKTTITLKFSKIS